jgi:hypothetical protein
MRRSRNIGTSAQGHGQDNKLVIPQIYAGRRDMLEDLHNPNFVELTVGGTVRTFIVEQTRDDSAHPCTVDDVARVLDMVTPEDLQGLQLIVFRQPTRKQASLSPVWGRLRYFMEVGRHGGAALFLESGTTKGAVQRFPRNMSVEDEAELDRFRRDGHQIIDDRRSISVVLDMKTQREVQLYRTVLHEVGHHVDYLEKVERMGDDGDWVELWEQYWQRPARERETFAHSYADRVGTTLRDQGRVPFARLDSEERIIGLGLRSSDFDTNS